jgi:hypothetical protein
MPGREPPLPRVGALQGVFDLAIGKYDIVVETGPSSATQRRETVEVLGDLVRSNPEMMQVAGDLLVKNIDGLKDADELSRRLKALLPPQVRDDGEAQIPPQVQEQMQQLEQALGEVTQELEKERSANLKGAGEVEKAKVQMAQIDLDRARLPKEEMLAQAELVNKQIQLEQSRRQGDAETAVAEATAGEKNANASIMNGFADATQMLTAAAGALSMAAQQMGGPKVKRGRAMRGPNGETQIEIVEGPVTPVA